MSRPPRTKTRWQRTAAPCGLRKQRESALPTTVFTTKQTKLLPEERQLGVFPHKGRRVAVPTLPYHAVLRRTKAAAAE